MKKTFPLIASHKASARVLDAVKHEIRKYVKRERRKAVPAGFDEWEFACKIGIEAGAAESKALRDVASAVDAIAASGASSVYVEVIAVPAHRVRTSATLDPQLATDSRPPGPA